MFWFVTLHGTKNKFRRPAACPIGIQRLERVMAQLAFFQTIMPLPSTKTLAQGGQRYRSQLAGITSSPMFDSQVARIIFDLAGISAALARKKGKKAFLQTITLELDETQAAQPIPVLRDQHRSTLAGITGSSLFNQGPGRIADTGPVVITTSPPDEQAFNQRVAGRILRLAGFFPAARATAPTVTPREAVLPAPPATLAA